MPRAAREQLPEIASSTRAVDLRAAARDAWPRHLIGDAERARDAEIPEPDAVVWPRDAEQVEALVARARREGTPLVPYGAGSGVCGAVHTAPGSVVLDTKRLTKLRLIPEEGVVEVGAGVLGIDFEETLGRHGYTVGHFPSSILCSTIGGWLAARGAGQCSSRYGKIEDMVQSADAVLGTGERVRFESRTGGPNLLDLLIGSEGTLGVITSARLRLHPAPTTRAFEAFRLESFAGGAEAMRVLMQAGLRPSVLRLYDPIDSYLLARGKVERSGERRSSGMPSGPWLRAALGSPRVLNGAVRAFERFVSGSATLIVIFEGEGEEPRGELARARKLLAALSAQSLGEGPARAWYSHRYAVSYRQSKVFQQGAFNDTLEVAAPWSKLLSVYDAVRAAAGRHALVLAHLSHAYPDGCSIYFTLVATREGDPFSRYDALIDAALAAALAEGATLSHHHGVGRSKAHWLDAELGGGVPTLRRLRRAWDPDGILSPQTLEPRREPPATRRREPVPGVDAVSGIATYRGDARLRDVERDANERGLTLGLVSDVPGLTLAAFVAEGLPGLPEPAQDPVRGSVCGLRARGGLARFDLIPAPRRATGPNLMALCVGGAERVARVEQASLALVSRDAPRASRAAGGVAWAEGEREAWARVVRAFSSAKDG